MTSGGVMPAGNCFSPTWASAITSEIAPSIFADGCGNTLTTATPLSDCDSMCSMLLTLVVRDRSKIDTMRVLISAGARQVKDQITLITGMLIFGKIFTGVRNRTTGLIRMSTSASTTNV